MSARRVGKVWIAADSLGLGGHLVDLEALVEPAARIVYPTDGPLCPDADCLDCKAARATARRILRLVEREAKR